VVKATGFARASDTRISAGLAGRGSRILRRDRLGPARPRRGGVRLGKASADSKTLTTRLAHCFHFASGKSVASYPVSFFNFVVLITDRTKIG
jgi:hypothetical protein